MLVRSALDLVCGEAPENPVALARPQQVSIAADWFLRHFPGDVFYALKANPAPWVLDALWAAGVRAFDVASETEVALVAERFPQARQAFMHPVKSRQAIRRAYHEYGVRVFALDTVAELEKILAETGQARDLSLVVRLAAPSTFARHKLDRKFGAGGEDAAALLRATRGVAEKLGVSFHVGSQCLAPGAYRMALQAAAGLVQRADVPVDIVDVGGGFPSLYADDAPPPLSAYMREIVAVLADLPALAGASLWCEPGRALVAEAGSHLVRVDLRKGNQLFINDGGYGALFDAAHCGVRFPVRLVRAAGGACAALERFELYGPTCDSIDYMRGPFLLPADLREGDYIEIGMTGAYGAVFATAFNGFGTAETRFAGDAPMLTMFADAPGAGAGGGPARMIPPKPQPERWFAAESDARERIAAT